MADPVQIASGFSVVNRVLLYFSFLLAPAQLASGLKNNCPSNIGFLAYSFYTQISWYRAITNKELHALCLILPHANILFNITFLGGATSGNQVMGVFLGFGTAGLMILNNVCGWRSWIIDQPDGFEVYRFFLFGWRTFNENWHKFMLVWQIADTIMLSIGVVAAIAIGIFAPRLTKHEEVDWWLKYAAIPVGLAVILFLAWPLIMWVELIFSSNNLQSDTDMVGVALFIVQVVFMLVPSCGW
ncbi:hypothetical protein B0H67DRAFT_485561 [Lasiosphaeris hirsuta]|uniref:Uncharacterized protein n=1 Tax=Lasiosphaeris hirsuta TaxID=260670 RepID=A0AA40ANS8_9PEZI|nr:hypothetical protein B0H67DRAFT_485561 [Lasiosphaeris hirsuta]